MIKNKQDTKINADKCYFVGKIRKNFGTISFLLVQIHTQNILYAHVHIYQIEMITRILLSFNFSEIKEKTLICLAVAAFSHHIRFTPNMFVQKLYKNSHAASDVDADTAVVSFICCFVPFFM